MQQQKLFIRFKIVCWNSENGNERSNRAYAFLYKRVLTYSFGERALVDALSLIERYTIVY